MTLFDKVSDGDRFTSLSFLSCGALQSDEIIGILKVLFRYVGNGTQGGAYEHGLAYNPGGRRSHAQPHHL